jgi:hypothetical protein
MKIIKNYIYYFFIFILIILLIVGFLINKKSSASKKNEISNLTLQIKTKNNQLSNIQKYFLENGKNINDFVNPKNINFSKILTDKKLKDLNNLSMSKYKTNDILFNGNFKALASAYVDFYNDDNELILATKDGIFASTKIESIKKFDKINSNIFELITYDDFYTHDQYGIKDILVYQDILFVSLIGQRQKNCHNFKILKSKITKQNLNFEIFYETPGCVSKTNNHGYYAGQGAGGRMFIKDDSLLFTTGEFRNRPLAQDKKNAYGKILSINLNSKEAKIISTGHRNPQGLYYSKKYDFIISTEHGPKGGDEININHEPSKKVRNYGWPISSYGEHYYKNHSKKILDEAPLNKSHKKYGFEEPVKYFVPSIGISEIIPLNDNDTEFLIGAMGSEIVEQDLGLHYIKLNGDRKKIIKHKYITLNERVRDIVISKNRDTVILFLETSSSLGVIKKIK